METGRVPATPASSSRFAKVPRKISTLLAELKSASSTRNLELGRTLHAEAIESGAEAHIFVASSLLDMYAKCGSMAEARRIFDRMSQHDVVSWTALILGYAQNGQGRLALELFQAMQRTGYTANAQTFVAALKACTSLASAEEAEHVGGRPVKMVSLENGMAIHSQAARLGFDSDIFVASTLADMYSKCGTMDNAWDVFERCPTKSSVLWNTLILGYALNGEGMLSLKLFSYMLSSHQCLPVRSTFLAVLKACTALAEKEAGRILSGKLRKVEALEIGMAIHAQASRNKLDLDLCVASSVVDMYCKSGSIGEARRVFDRMKKHDTVSWNSLILGYARNGDGTTGLQLFSTMISEGFVPVRSTFLAVLEACIVFSQEEECQHVQGKVVKVVSLETAMAIHSRVDTEAVKRQQRMDTMVANTLIDVYAKCGSMSDSQRVFDGMAHRNLVSWTILMFGYAQNDKAKVVLDLFSQMRYSQQSWIPSSQTLVAAIQAAADIATLTTGRKLHGDVCRLGLELEAHIQSSLVDLYGKCGNTVGSQLVFDSAPWRGIEMWSSVIAGHSRRGDYARVFELFDGMVEAGIYPNEITFLSLQIACSRAGLVEKAEMIFEQMKNKYGVRPGIEHYHCLIDLLGRANQLEKAVRVVESMPFKATAVTWMTVLAACQKWKDVRIGKRAFDSVLRLDRDKEQHSAAYVLMAEIYESS